MARPPIDWKKRCVELEGQVAALMRDKANLERNCFELSFSQSNAKTESENLKEKNTKLYGIIEYLEDHIHTLNSTIEDLRKPNERT